MPKLPSHADIVANLRAIRSAASSDQVREGRAWYPAMGRLIAVIGEDAAADSGIPVSKSLAVGVFAAYSQNATWKANVTMATKYLTTRELRGMKTVIAEIALMEAGTDPREALGALKRPDFYSNLMGDYSVVTCDRWHLRAALGEQKYALTPEVRDAVTSATRELATEFEESPAACQAVIWCTVRPSGNGK